MLTSAFIRYEIDAITEKWREIQKGSERKGEGLAMFYRLHIHPDLWRGIQEFLDTLSAEGREPFVFPEVFGAHGQLRIRSRRWADPADRRRVAGAQILIGLATPPLTLDEISRVRRNSKTINSHSTRDLFSKYPTLA